MFSRIKNSLLALTVGLAMIIAALSVLTSTASSDVEVARLSGVDMAPAASGLRFVDDMGAPITGAVRVLCYATPSAGAPPAERVMVANSNGDVVVPPGCNYVAALQLKHEQPAGKPNHGPAYWVYATSWSPGDTAPSLADGTITISDDSPLVLFNVVASLAWEPVPGSAFVSDLRQGLFYASEYLYDLTDGRMAFGPVSISTGGRRWNGADLRFLASNASSPWAFVGGIVTQHIPYTPTVASTALTPTVYAPGAVYLGRHWDGTTASSPLANTWSQMNAYRTIIHEWLHYADFLYDEYQDSGGMQTYCTCNDLLTPGICASAGLEASAMAWQYTASELWNDHVHGNPTTCTGTRQWEVHQQSDWETLEKWYHIQGLDGLSLPPLVRPYTLAAGPGLGLTGDLFGRAPGYHTFLPAVLRPDSSAQPTIIEPTILASLTEQPASTETLSSQVYVLEGGSISPTRILYQGQLITDPLDPGYFGRIKLLGVQESQDQARIFVERYNSGSNDLGGRFAYPNSTVFDFTLYDGLEVLANAEAWEIAPISLNIAQELSDGMFTKMSVTLTGLSQALGITPTAQLCIPDAAIGCHSHWRQDAMLPTGVSDAWTAVFTPLPGFEELPLYGTLRVQAADAGEIIRWFQVAGGVGPAHERADAPARDGLLMVDSSQALPWPGECNQVLVSPAANAEALMQSLPIKDQSDISIAGVIGPPLDIDILLPTADGVCASLGSGDHTLPVPVVLTLFYRQDVIDRLVPLVDLQEVSLHILRFDRESNTWFVQSTLDSDENLNWLSTLVEIDGIYAIGWALPWNRD